MRKLLVAGCSWSDLTRVDKCYGEWLSEEFNAEYHHHGSGVGSNWRIWRTVSEKIINQTFNRDDILLIQYTSPIRQEFWSSYVETRAKCLTDHYGNVTLREDYDDGQIIKFKVNMVDYQIDKNEKQLFTLYESYFLNRKFEMRKQKQFHMMFQCMCKEYDLPNVFFVKAVGYSEHLLEYPMLPYYDNNSIELSASNPEYKKEYWLSPDDPSHLSTSGHKWFSEWLTPQIKDRLR